MTICSLFPRKAPFFMDPTPWPIKEKSLRESKWSQTNPIWDHPILINYFTLDQSLLENEHKIFPGFNVWAFWLTCLLECAVHTLIMGKESHLMTTTTILILKYYFIRQSKQLNKIFQYILSKLSHSIFHFIGWQDSSEVMYLSYIYKNLGLIPIPEDKL